MNLTYRYRQTVRVACCLLWIAASALAAHALPPGYKGDFNGCARESNEEVRKTCCHDTFHDCHAQCQSDFDEGSNDRIQCVNDCLYGLIRCDDGETLPLTAGWPGVSGAEVQGLLVETDRTVPARGFDLVPSRSAVLVELRDHGDSSSDACVAFVVACQCPAGADDRGQECRASIDGNATACRICRRGAPADTCKPCPDCRPELLSAQPCAAPDLPAARGRDARYRRKTDPGK